MDMKRLGIMDDIKEGLESKKKLIIKQRHISPPPPVTQGQDQLIKTKNSPIAPGLGEATLQKGGDQTIITNGEEDVESTNTNTQKITIKGVDTSKFNYFPFQRRARSLSLPKDEEGND